MSNWFKKGIYLTIARVILSPSVILGEMVTVAIRLVSPGHDDGALVRSHLIYESNYDELIRVLLPMS